MQLDKNLLFASLISLMVLLGLSFFNKLSFSVSSALLAISIAACGLYMLVQSNYEFPISHLLLVLAISFGIIVAFFGLGFNYGFFMLFSFPFMLPFLAIRLRKRLVKQ